MGMSHNMYFAGVSMFYHPMQTRPRLIPLGLPPPILSDSTALPSPNLNLLTSEGPHDVDVDIDAELKPATVDIRFEQIFGELFRSFQEESLLHPDKEQREKSRRHTDEKTEKDRRKQNSDEPIPLRSATVAGQKATSELPVLTFKDREKKCLHPRKTSTKISPCLDQKREVGPRAQSTAKTEHSTARRPARELFPPLEIKAVRKPRRKLVSPSKPNSTATEATNQMAELSIDSTLEADNGTMQRKSEIISITGENYTNPDTLSRRLEKRSYNETETEVDEIAEASFPLTSTREVLELVGAQSDTSIDFGEPIVNPKESFSKPVITGKFFKASIEDPLHEIPIEAASNYMVMVMLSLFFVALLNILDKGLPVQI